ncbi:hypothetical protein GGS21DRAFT_494328 [Xylaria nigripes]|nr:hypothetical protein GGS21DRAFT_494328 [Xylaria nigripes]
MEDPRVSKPCSPHDSYRRGDDFRDEVEGAVPSSPSTLIAPKPLRPGVSSPKFLSHYHRFPSPRLQSITSTPSPPPHIQLYNTNGQPISTIALKMDRLKYQWRGFKNRIASPESRIASYVLYVIFFISFGTMIVGWYALSKNSANHQVSDSIKLSAPSPEYAAYLWPAQTLTQDQLRIRADADPTDGPLMVRDSPSITQAPSANLSDELDQVTVFCTSVVTVTSVVTDEAQKTLTTTVFLSTSTVEKATSTTNSATCTETTDVTTGIRYCSFTGRPNVYTLCSTAHANSSAMNTGAPVTVSSATRGFNNPFSALRAPLAWIYNALQISGSGVQKRVQGECSDCLKKLETVMRLVLKQQHLINSQYALLAVQERLINRQYDLLTEQLGLLSKNLEMIGNMTLVNASDTKSKGRGQEVKV